MNTIQDDNIRKAIDKYLKSNYWPTIILGPIGVNIIESYRDNADRVSEDPDFKAMSSDDQKWIIQALATGFLYSDVEKRPSFISDKAWNTINRIVFPGRRLKALKKQASEYIANAEIEYQRYYSERETLLTKIQSEIDVINRRKPIMKDSILKKVSIRLNEMGIKSEVKEYPMESIDTRKFGLEDKLKELKQSFDFLNNDTYAHFLENIPAVHMPIVHLLVNKKIDSLKEQINNIKLETQYFFERVKSENKTIENLYRALKNIAEIFTDITTKLDPVIDEILDTIAVKNYNNNPDKTPSKHLCLLRTLTAILKTVAEKSILPHTERDALIQATITTSNNLSVEYDRLRIEMSNQV